MEPKANKITLSSLSYELVQTLYFSKPHQGGLQRPRRVKRNRQRREINNTLVEPFA